MCSVIKKPLAALFAVILLLSPFSTTLAAGERNTVYVGCMNLPNFLEEDGEGNYTGCCKEMLDEICTYTGWEIAYVYGTWAQQVQWLSEGKLDIVPNAQYTEERDKIFDYTDQSVGIIQCILFAAQSNNEIYYNDFEAMNGKRIGIMGGSKNIGLLDEYAQQNGFDYILQEYGTQLDIEAALARGEVDLIAAEQMAETVDVKVISHLGSDPYYFMTRQDDHEIMGPLNAAISMINSKDPTYISELYKKYYSSNKMNSTPAFSKDEAEFIKEIAAKTLYLIPNNEPFSFIDKNGNISGIVPGIMDLIGKKAGIAFRYDFLPDSMVPAEFILRNPGEIVAGVVIENIAFQNEKYAVSDSIYSNQIKLLYRQGWDSGVDLSNGSYRMASVDSFQAFELYVEKNYPNMKICKVDSIESGMKAVSDGKADFFGYTTLSMIPMMGNPRFKSLNILSDTFMEIDLGLVGAADDKMRSFMDIINKCISVIPDADIRQIEDEMNVMSKYDISLADTLHNYRFIIFAAAALLLTCFALLFAANRRKTIYANSINKKNEELALAIRRADAANKAKTDFLANMSHDIRTPLNAIIGFLDIVRRYRYDEKRVDDSIKKMEESSQHLLSLINDVLDVNKLESDSLPITNRPFDMELLLKECQDIVEGMISELALKFTSRIGSLPHKKVIGSELRVRQILLNILSNAVKYNKTGGSIELLVNELSADENTVTYEFVVKDTGIGMSREFLRKIFDTFSQEEQNHYSKLTGTGLGMSIVKKLVDLFSGTIEIESELGAGSTFRVVLPFMIDHSNTVAEVRSENDIDISGMTILVAEDISFNADIVQLMLEEAGAVVDLAENGQIAVDKFKAAEPGKYSAILMDIKMPVMDGLEATKTIRALEKADAKSVPIIAMTANTFEDDVETCLKAGINAHMGKPLNMRTFLSILSRYAVPVKEAAEKELKVRSGYYWEKMFFVGSGFTNADEFQDVIEELLSAAGGVGMILGSFEKDMPILIASNIAITMLGYTSYQEFDAETGSKFVNIFSGIAPSEAGINDPDDTTQKGACTFIGKGGAAIPTFAVKRILTNKYGKRLWCTAFRRIEDCTP